MCTQKYRFAVTSILACTVLSLVPSAPAFSYEGHVEKNVTQTASDDSYIVDFNTQTLKYHDPNCIWAQRCTVHCIKISRAEAKRRGGVACKVCNGGELQ
jgi:hypothetical protein